mmetsp:Transcript_10217/g.15418  ORF Transcript_10217/g.15418 Transcript_10217/m.15418 type:complete len:96 (+) Transcript_10217:154-441(+)
MVNSVILLYLQMDTLDTVENMRSQELSYRRIEMDRFENYVSMGIVCVSKDSRLPGLVSSECIYKSREVQLRDSRRSQIGSLIDSFQHIYNRFSHR